MPVVSDLKNLTDGFDNLQDASYEINLALGECHPAAKLIQAVIYVIAAEIDKLRDQLRSEGQLK